MRRLLARAIDAVGNLLVLFAAACYEAAYALNPELLEANHPQRPSTTQTVDHVLARVSAEERASLCEEAVQMAEDTNHAVYVVPAGAMRRWVN